MCSGNHGNHFVGDITKFKHLPISLFFASLYSASRFSYVSLSVNRVNIVNECWYV